MVVDPEKQPPGVGVCATCGRSITHPGPDGECVRCLVSFGFLADEHERPGDSGDGQAVLGPLHYAHFEVDVTPNGHPVILGAGAMAVTYRARDTILTSTVALKVISRKLAQNPTARARFLREARAAAQIRHPNVARVTYYGEQDGECFYAMQFVRGETLEARVQRGGPLSLSLALEIIEQTARGLAAGEACGVVHRDLKPSNVMVESDPSGHLIVKIIDYGVAKVMAPDATYETQAGFIGTPAFASPEQFNETGQQQIDTRSDIYSLGVTFWFLLCGNVPFVGRTLEDIRERQAQPLPLEQLRGLHIPIRCLSLLKSMLASEAKDRPQSARELLARVHRCYIKFGSEARARRRHSALAAAGVVVVVIAIGLGAWLYQRAQSSAQVERSIAVLPFENLSPNGEDNYFTVGMQDEITSDLARLAGMKVIGSQSTRSYQPGETRDLRAIGRELGVRHLLEGAVSRDSAQMRVALRLVDLRDSAHPWTEKYERPIKDVFALQSEITRAVAARLQRRLSRSETAALDLPPTTDLQAYDLYLRALALPRLVKDSDEQFRTTQKCISLLEEAVARDPKFVAAYCEIAESHDVLYRTRQVLPVEDRGTIDHRALAETALAKARRIQPDAGRVHLALASHFFSTNNDLEQARIEVDLARRTMPNSSDLELTAGAIARGQSRWDDAVRCFEKAVAVEPRQNVNRFTLANTHRLMRHYGDYDRLMAEVINMMPAKDSAAYRVFRAFGPWEARADLAPLRAAVKALSPEDDRDGRVRDLHNVILGLADHDADAISRSLAPAAASTFVFNGVAYPKSWYEGLAARIRGDQAGARIAFTAARVEVEKAVLADPTDGRALSLLAMIDAGLGSRDAAILEARQACDLEPFGNKGTNAPIVRCNLAVVYAWNGQTDLAIAELGKLVGKPAGSNIPAQPTYGDFRLNPLWDPLRSDPRFEALAQDFAPGR